MDEPFDKKSFLIYKHDYNSVSYLSNEDLGLLFRTICEYQNDKMAYFEIDPRIQQAFQFFKTRLDFDEKRYFEKTVKNNRKNGAKNKKNNLEV